MVDVLGISNYWEIRMRKVKRSIIKALGSAPDFTCVYVSEDMAEDIKKDTGIIGEVGVDTTFETVPLLVDKDLPHGSVVYIWKEK